MKWFVKFLLPILLVTTFVGAFGVGLGNMSIDDFLSEVLPFDSAIDKKGSTAKPLKFQQTIDPQQGDRNNIAAVGQSADALLNTNASNKIFVNEVINNSSPSTGVFSPNNYLPEFISVDKSSSVAGIDGTGGAQPRSDRGSGIDGTGGPRPQISDTIDGTGAPQPLPGPGNDTQNAGIDGTGGSETDGDIGPINPDTYPRDPSPPTPLIGPQIIAWGTLQKVGDHLMVNGVKFSIDDNTQMTIDGDSNVNAAELMVGQVVIVSGVEPKPVKHDGATSSLASKSNNLAIESTGEAPSAPEAIDSGDVAPDSYVAQQITYTTQISGEITVVAADNSLTVLGQKVVLHDEVVFGGTATSFDDLVRGDHISVSGFRRSDGALAATRIDRIKSAVNKVSGLISQLNELDQTFRINNLLLSYSDADNLSDIDNGVRVDVQGELDDKTSVLDASSVQMSTSVLDGALKQANSKEDNTSIKLQVEGYITELELLGSDDVLVNSHYDMETFELRIDDLKVIGDLQTEYIGGGHHDLELNKKLEIEGTLNSNNVLVAQRVIFQTAEFTSHKIWGARLSSDTETFSWSDVDADAYRLKIFFPGGKPFYDQTFDGNTTSVTVSGLPLNSPCIHTYLYTLQGEFWSHKLYHFCGPGVVPNSQITSHKSGDTLGGTTETFTFSKVEGVELYRLRIHDVESKTNYFEDTFTEPKSVEVSNLPSSGADVDVSVMTLHNGWWSSSFMRLKSINPEKENATIIRPEDYEPIAGSTETFTWKNVGAEQYELRIARKHLNDWFDIVDLKTFKGSPNNPIVSATVNNLPINSGEVLIRLRTKHNGWATEHYTFTGSGEVADAELTSPAANPENSELRQLLSSTEELSWTKVPEAQAYHLKISNVYGDYNQLIAEEDYNNYVTSDVIEGLPENGAEVEVTLSTRVNGYWGHKKYRLQGAGTTPDAEITSHSQNQVVTSSSTEITWNNVNADAYHLQIEDISVAPNVDVHNQAYGPETTSVEIDNLPENSTLKVLLMTKHGDWWAEEELTIFTDTRFSPDRQQDDSDEPQAEVETKDTTVLGTLHKLGNSLVVNGLSFEMTDVTQITVDGKSASFSQLHDGQVIIIQGRVDESGKGIAENIIYTTQISGQITAITDTAITVLGQTIALHDSVYFGESVTQLSDFQVGDVVTISGYSLSAETLSATRIDRVTNTKEIITGTISQLNESEKTFTINGLIVGYSQVSQLPVLNNGLKVTVQGVADIDDQSLLHADSIIGAASVLDNTLEKLTLEGLITEYTDAADFKVNDVVVSTDLQTEFVGGDRDDIALNAKIQVEGYLYSNNVLIAENVKFLVAGMTSHKDRTAISSPTQTFQWSDVNASAYRLVILDTHDNDTFYDEEFDGNTISATITGLPENNSKFFVNLYTKQGGFWSKKVYRFYGSSVLSNSELTSPTDGEALQNTTATFTFSEVAGAEAYRLRVYNHHSNADYYDKTFTDPEAVTLTGLPTNGADIDIVLFTKHKGWWSRNYYQVTSVQTLENTFFTSHTDRQSLTDSTQTFTWKDVGADQYELRIAQRYPPKDWFEIIDLITFDGSVTSVTLDDLPINGADVLIRLRTQHNGGWGTKYYTFKGSGEISEAEVTSHSDKEVLSSTTQTFSWSVVPEAEQYYIRVRNSEYNNQSIRAEDYDTHVFSHTFSDLPKNSAKVLLTMSTKVNGYWGHKYYTLYGSGELPDAKINSHTWNQSVTTPSTTISWDDVNADAYYLEVIDVSNGRTRLHKQTYGADTTSVNIDDLPKNTILEIIILTKHGEWWAKNYTVIETNIP